MHKSARKHHWLSLISLGLALTLSTLAAKADPPPVERLSIGQLKLRYSKEIWLAENLGQTLRIRCILSSCAGLVFDITARPRPDGHCDEREADAKAKALWPAIERRGTNLMKVGRLALVVTEVYEQENLLGRSGVFACMTRHGIQYDLASTMHDRKESWDAAGWLYQLALGFEAENPQRTLTLGGMDLTIPTDRWDETLTTDKARVLTCLPPGCDDWQSTVVVKLEAGVAECTAPYPGYGGEYYDVRETSLLAGYDGKLRFLLYSYWNGCRNWTPPHVLACTAHKGSTYWFSTPSTRGCHDYREIPDATFADLLNGLRMQP